MAKWAALAACVMGLVAVAVSLSREPLVTVPPHPNPEVYVTGERVQVKRAEALLKGDAIGLQAGDIISTATNHRATIAYAHESTRIEIQPGSVVVFGDATNGKRFELRRGIIRARVAAQPADHPLRVKTALARATVLGTEFVMRVDEGTTKLDVLEGKIEFACRTSGKKVKVKAGFSAALRSDAPPFIVPLCSSNCILRECRGTNAMFNLETFKTEK
jgi:ferric-dicitrate binding protein FerR (iron transport regulator)